MSANELLQQPAAQAVGWALLHFVWQGALIGGLTAIVLAVLHRSAADVRYVVATIGLSLMVTMPAVTGMQVWRGDPGRVPVPAGFAGEAPVVAPPTEATGARSIDAPGTAFAPADGFTWRAFDAEPWLPMLVAVWFVGVLALTLRLASGWLLVQRLKTRGTSAARPALRSAVARLEILLHVRRHVRLLESTLVDVPTVIGWLKPVVLVPACALAGLTPTQVEAILAHELAHIRRHDYLVNLLQTLVETLLFYHPAVWWLSARIRAEREICCDDLAVSLCGDPFTYASALADLEDLRGAGGQLVMAASRGSLLYRVRRLLGAPAHDGRAPGWLAAGAAILVMLGIVAGAAGTSAATAQSPVAVAAQPERAAAPALPAVPPETAERRAPIAAPEPRPAKATAVASTARAAEEARGALEATAAKVAETAVAVTQASSSQSVSQTKTGRTTGNFIHSNNGEKIEVSYDGEIEFTDDDTDVKRLSPGGTIRIRDAGRLGDHTVEFRADASGTITRRYWAGATERPFEPEGREWLARALPRLIRQTGLGAKPRVARILKAGGPAGVLREIALIEGSWAKRLYFTELLKTPLDAATTRQVLVQAGTEIESDYELASLLVDSADRLLVDEATRQAYFDAVKTIDSDYEARRVYASALKRGPVSGPLLAGILDASRAIGSDYEQASLLVQVAGLQPLDKAVHGAFFRAVASVESDYERGRVLKEVVRRQDATNETVLEVIRAARGMGSDYEKSQVLQAVAASRQLSGEARDAYIEVATALGEYEQGRALSALVKSERRESRESR